MVMSCETAGTRRHDEAERFPRTVFLALLESLLAIAIRSVTCAKHSTSRPCLRKRIQCRSLDLHPERTMHAGCRGRILGFAIRRIDA
jgi:hypothetical protein